MKFGILLTAFIIFGLSGCKKDGNSNSYKKIRSITGYMVPAEGPSYGQRFIADEEVFDEEGRLISSVKGALIYNQSNYFNPKTYTYQDGRLIETKDAGETRNEYKYTNNLLTQVDIYYGDNYMVKSLAGKEVYFYDSQNRKIKATFFSYRPGYGRNPPPPNPNGYTYTYEYNAANLLTKETDEGGSVNAYEYDAHKNLTKITYSNTYTPGTVYVNETHTYKYDFKDRVIEDIQTDYLGASVKIETVFDFDGRIQTKNVFKSFSGQYYLASAITYEYKYY
ncbi:RHS repeat domain-containing protein [Mucilaginibacter calamicampi]|uniref:RHS repeat domain-containing protein n=1 Tax=Mucilaginibacter calamicampi TaxID=1302352 RepID=A0ABW2YT12_9SPHI